MTDLYRKLAICLSLVILFGAAGLSANKTFTGTGNFSNAALWGGSLPGPGDNLKIDGTCTFDNAASSLAYGNLTLGVNVAGSIVWPVGGTNSLNVNNITSSIAGGQVDMTNGGTLRVSGAWKSNAMSFTPGAGTVAWNVTGSSTLPTAFTTYNNLTIESGSTVSATANFNVLGTMTIQSGGTFSPAAPTVVNASGPSGTLTGSGTIVVTRTAATADFSSQYKFATNDLSSLTVTYSGVSAQKISGLTYGNLVISNASGVALGGNVTVAGVLTLTAGVATTGSYSIAVTNASAAAEVITGGTIIGQVQRSIAAADTGTYAFGDSNTYVKPDGTQGAISVSVTAFPNTNAPGDPNHIAINGYYLITPSGPLTATLCLSYTSAEVRAGQNESNFTLWHFDGASWTDQGAVLKDPVNNWVEQVGISNFSPWTIAESGSPLPITLASFTAMPLQQHGAVTLTWKTISETDNLGFYVERSDGMPTAFKTIPNSFIPGNGTTLQQHQYSWTDNGLVAGSYFYRLKQVDRDGSVHYSEALAITVLMGAMTDHTPAAFSLGQNYPNPFNPSTEIRFSVETAGRATLRVYTIAGQEVATLFDGVAQPGQYYSAKLDGSRLASGTYIYRVESAGRSDMKKMVLLK